MKVRLRVFLDLLQQRETSRNVFGNFVAGWQRIQSAVLRLACEEVKGHGLATFKNLVAGVKDIRLS